MQNATDADAKPQAGPLATPEPWDMVSDAYTAEVLPQFELFSADALRLAGLPADATIADVAAGPGTLALMAAADGAKVSALDFSPAMIANLERRAHRLGLKLDVRLGDGQALPFAADAFDGAFSMFGLMFFPDRGAGFRELRRVLRPGGRAVVSSWAPMDGPFLAMMKALREILTFLPPPKPLPMGEPGQIREEMEAAGFREVAVHPCAHPLVYASLDEFWGRAQRTAAPILLLRKKVGEEKWSEVSAGVQERLRNELGTGPQTMSGLAYLGIGTK
jgi:SAM-dependent methyltransferase